jgi:hypothetical protein
VFSRGQFEQSNWLIVLRTTALSGKESAVAKGVKDFVVARAKVLTACAAPLPDPTDPFNRNN